MTEPSDPDMLAEMNAGSGELNQRLQVVITEASAERIVATMPVEGNRQPYGLLHGGASVALAESLGSTLAALNCPDGKQAVGVDIYATHHRSALSGFVTGTTTLLSAGRTLVVSETVVADDEGRRVCTVRLTCFLRDVRQQTSA